MTNREKFLTLVSKEETNTVARAKERLRRSSLKELRAHELYRALISTSKIYNDNMELLTQVLGNEELVERYQERLKLISDVFAELVGLERKSYGEPD